MFGSVCTELLKESASVSTLLAGNSTLGVLDLLEAALLSSEWVAELVVARFSR